MKLNCNSALSATIGAALIGVAGAASAVEPIISDTNTGQALIFPYYTVNGGWITTLNVMNTSDKTLAVKVRFREKKNSRDVLDFNIVMSPYDAWTGFVQDSPTGPVLKTSDKSCTSPLNVDGAAASKIAYTGQFSDTGGDGEQRMRDGYVEMLVMGVADSGAEDVAGTVPYWAKHINGEPRDCVKVDQAFIATEQNWVPDTDPTDPALYNQSTQVMNKLAGSGNPTARDDFVAPTAADRPLKGNITWLLVGSGAGAGGTAIAVADWSDQNFVTAQQFPWFLEPTFASSDDLWTISGVEAFEEAILATATFNEWASNPATGAATDWAITFPTKAYHVDRFNNQIQAAVSKYRNGLANITAVSPAPGVSPFEYAFGARTNYVEGLGDSPITVQYTVFDREENSEIVETDGTTISPAPPPEVVIETLRFEANVVQFANQSVLGSTSPSVVDAVGLLPPGSTPNGWAKVDFAEAIPVTAFAVKARNQGDPSTAYGQAMDNGYERPERMQ
jgi:hypothetical protein